MNANNKSNLTQSYVIIKIPFLFFYYIEYNLLAILPEKGILISMLPGSLHWQQEYLDFHSILRCNYISDLNFFFFLRSILGSKANCTPSWKYYPVNIATVLTSKNDFSLPYSEFCLFYCSQNIESTSQGQWKENPEALAVKVHLLKFFLSPFTVNAHSHYLQWPAFFCKTGGVMCGMVQHEKTWQCKKLWHLIIIKTRNAYCTAYCQSQD